MKYRHLTSTLLLPTLFLFASASPSLEERNVPLKFNSEDLICHGEECYPRIFMPTDEFQIIRDDQEIPPGLHVRLNLETGVKEAKINVPSPDDSALEGVSVELEREGDIVVVSEAVDEPMKAAPDTYKPSSEGAIKPPPTVQQESLPFSDSVKTVLSPLDYSTEELASALSSLEELVHEIYWGHELSTPGTASALLALARDSTAPNIRASAALVLGSALSNNPKALRRATSEGGIMGRIVNCLHRETDEPVKLRLMYLLNQAMKSDTSRNEFLDAEGMDLLLGIWNASNQEVKGKIAVFVEDNFLNEDMRAEGRLSQQKDGRLTEKFDHGLSFCRPFHDGLGAVETDPPMDTEVKAKIFSALAALKRKFKQKCSSEQPFREWVVSLADWRGMTAGEVEEVADGELKIMAKENLELFMADK